VDPVAALAGAVAGLLLAPLADRLATNAPLHEPLLRRVPRSRALPLLGLALAGLLGACGLAFGFTLEALAAGLLCASLVVLTRTDLEHRLLPDVIVLPGALSVLAVRTVDEPRLEWVAAGLAAALVLFVVVLLYPRGLGLGDVKLAALLGAGLGVAVTVAFFVGFFLAFLPAAVLFARHGREARTRAIPLGPFLAAGAVVALFAGDEILDWYTSLGR
ncbi:MAG TPA: A24 family peptidase, partial [Gaiellaceae bacterium]|nr:A24 family peptidase [Gaiellaceae bacterium]